MKFICMYYKMVDSFLFSLPVPVSINCYWGVGSMLGMCITVQILSGLVLSMFYSCGVEMSFLSVVYVMTDVSGGWLVRYVHSSGASLLMLLMYVHILRGLWYGSYKNLGVWVVGVIIVVMLSLVSFLGYVLPWGQMSFWAATVITSMVTAVPYVGNMMSLWLWGSFTVGDSTLVRFFSFHYIMSIMVVLVVLIHLINLHELGSYNPVGAYSGLDKLVFHPLFSYKDLVGLVMLIWMYVVVVFWNPLMSMDSVNFEECSSLKTPVHIKPEWYFLYAYCVLRSVSSKMGGVLMMCMSMLILLVPCLSRGLNVINSCSFFVSSVFVVMVIWSFFGLTILGGCLVEYPFELLGKVFTLLYFFSMIMIPISSDLSSLSWLVKNANSSI
nr:cytochrome b [Moniliformis sp. XH-2020]